MTDQRDRLIGCFRAVFPNLTEDEILQLSLESTKDWDSIASMNLVSTIEEEFGFHIPPEDLDDLGSFPSALSYIGSRLGS